MAFLTAVGTEAWQLERQGDALIVRFVGHLDATAGQDSAAAVAASILEHPTATDLVLDVEHMSGYAPGARRAWQSELGPHRGRLASVKTRGASTLVRMGATVLGLFLGLGVEHHE
ncbi:MAG: hypothetical protein H6721_32575 [Sandaracinus sp.]|nr:hypothetical protein [Myxococcales bacterium]MCB9604608.1 hypothetical protein [Sandaracinus sp.]MCB9616261.1 hypothetical protein [Sandaracinus sp.]MCB9617997.1 hypothetical protein [Sandaracinus sp.]MCB9633575.1 hypothetical protein [Sandaracinus sp.]